MPFLTIAISPEHPFPGEAEAYVRLLHSGNCDFLHLRHPHASANAHREILEALPQELMRRITLGSCLELAEEYPVGGVHWNSHILRDYLLKHPKITPIDEWGNASYETPVYGCKLGGDDSILRVSCSCHTADELREASETGMFAYAFLSPIYDSISKVGYRSRFSDAELKEIISCTTTPVVALGGITPQKMPHLKALGFSGAAMLGYFFNNQVNESSIR